MCVPILAQYESDEYSFHQMSEPLQCRGQNTIHPTSPHLTSPHLTYFTLPYLENRKCFPQHGALNAPSAGVAFSAVTIAVSEAFLLPAAENWSRVGRHILAPGS
jgi:hypothetical protein